MRPTGLGEGDSLKAGDDRSTLSTSLLPPFWKIVFCYSPCDLKQEIWNYYAIQLCVSE